MDMVHTRADLTVSRKTIGHTLPVYKDEFIQLLAVATLALCLCCFLLIGIPIYYGVLPQETPPTSADSRQILYPGVLPQKAGQKVAGATEPVCSPTVDGPLPLTRPSGHHSSPQPEPQSRSRSKKIAATQPDVQAVVIRVVDGDTIQVGIPSFPPILGVNITVRLASCDTPELSSKEPFIRARALEAKAVAESLAPPGSIVWLRDIQRDKYFRLLARVEAHGVDIATQLLERGLALPYDGGKKPEHPNKRVTESMAVPAALRAGTE